MWTSTTDTQQTRVKMSSFKCTYSPRSLRLGIFLDVMLLLSACFVFRCSSAANSLTIRISYANIHFLLRSLARRALWLFSLSLSLVSFWHCYFASFRSFFGHNFALLCFFVVATLFVVCASGTSTSCSLVYFNRRHHYHFPCVYLLHVPVFMSSDQWLLWWFFLPTFVHLSSLTNRKMKKSPLQFFLRSALFNWRFVFRKCREKTEKDRLSCLHIWQFGINVIH